MKIGILTHYDVSNQGAQLQMYALTKKLEEMGNEVKTLTYHKNYDFFPDQEKRNQISIKSIPYIFKNFVIKKGVALTWHNTKKYLKNKKFRENNFVLQNYATADIDCAVVGSDEVLSIECGANMMMYGHCVNTNYVFSYAAAFGQTDVELLAKYHCTELVRSGLEKMFRVAVRDEKSADTVLKLTGKKPEIVCDPVLLYDFSNTHTEYKPIKKPYLVVYAYDKNMNDPEEIKAIRAYAKENGLLIVSPGTYHKWCDINIACDCLQWIEYMRNAQAIITDTFHGTILSIITNRPMAIKVRHINTNKLNALINEFQLNERKVEHFDADALKRIFSQDVNFELVNSIWEDKQRKGEEYIKNTLNMIRQENEA